MKEKIRTTHTGSTEFNELIEQLTREVRKIKQRNDQLQNENVRIRNELERLRESKDVFADLPENQKRVLKNQIETLIGRIDDHLQ